MSLSEQINAVIQQNLPAAVAKELQTYLDQAQKDSAAYEALKTEYTKVTTRNAELIAGERKANEIVSREGAVAAKELELKIKEEVLKVRESYMSIRLDDMKQLTNAVFQSNRFNYNVNLDKSHSIYNSQTGYTNTHSEITTGTVTHE